MTSSWKLRPSVVVIDPTGLTVRDDELELKPMLMRLIDFLKTKGITASHQSDQGRLGGFRKWVLFR